jgi:NAD-reducing hydrogenase large subunit
MPRELVHCAQFVQSHALSFFHLSAPDLLLGFDSDPPRRNVFGLIEQKHVRSHAAVNCLEGVGMIEAPRGVLIHHYKVNEEGAITWANLIVATGHNNLAINRGVAQVAKHFIDGGKLQEGMLNRVSALVRAYDPCLSCSTHADGTLAMEISLHAPDGTLLDSMR